MKVSELIELLSKMNPDKEVEVWNCEWDCSDPVSEVREESEKVVVY